MSPLRLLAALALVSFAYVAEANPCATGGSPDRDGSGMGGTGIMAARSEVGQGFFDGGLGGTGLRAEAGGMGGTGLGNDSSGMGGTGRMAKGSGIGGTGQVAKGSGIGGTGQVAKGSGVGGTGQVAKGSGLGGTGRMAKDSGLGGTGIVGVITGFGSICINGIEVHYDRDTPVRVDGRSGSAEQLALGQVVSVLAEGRGDSLRASRIELSSMLLGPVSEVSPKGDRFVVLGQPVRLASARGSVFSIAPAYRPRPGDYVRVSGLPGADGQLMATRVESLPAQPGVAVVGSVEQASGKEARIGGIAVRLPHAVQPGVAVRASGTFRDGKLYASRVERADWLKFGPAVDRLVLQGVVNRDTTPDRLSLGYASVRVPERPERVVARPGEVVKVEAFQRPDGVLEARRIEVMESRDLLGERPALSDLKALRSARKAEIRDNDGSPRELAREPDREVQRGERNDRPEPREREEKDGPRPDLGWRARERVERPERGESHDRVEVPEKIAAPEKAEAPEKVSVPEKAERPEKVEAPEKVERPEKVETPEKVEVPEKIEAPEKIELPEKFERD